MSAAEKNSDRPRPGSEATTGPAVADDTRHLTLGTRLAAKKVRKTGISHSCDGWLPPSNNCAVLATRSSRGSGTACPRACGAVIPRTADVRSGSRRQGAPSPTRPMRWQLRSTGDQQSWVEYGLDAANVRRWTVDRTRVHRPDSGTLAGRIESQSSVPAGRSACDEPNVEWASPLTVR